MTFTRIVNLCKVLDLDSKKTQSYYKEMIQIVVWYTVFLRKLKKEILMLQG